eukprot:scaffold2362_cov109-Cylindrotheca_fusiformis.AAC.7
MKEEEKGSNASEDPKIVDWCFDGIEKLKYFILCSYIFLFPTHHHWHVTRANVEQCPTANVSDTKRSSI